MSEPSDNARVTCAPDDVRSSMLWFDESREGFTSYAAYPNPDGHMRGCLVYWGSHGCERPHGHKGPHWCDCCDCEPGTHPADGCVAGPPYYGFKTRFYGQDVRVGSRVKGWLLHPRLPRRRNRWRPVKEHDA